MAKEDDLKGFAIAGKDGKFVWADAKINGATVVVSSATVPQPAAVRYSWSQNPFGDMATEAHLSFLDTATLFTEHGAKGLVMGAVGPAESDICFHCDMSQGATSLGIDSEMNDIVVTPAKPAVRRKCSCSQLPMKWP